MQLIEKLNYEIVINEISVIEEMTSLLDDRRSTSKLDNFVPWNEAKKQLRFKSDK